MPSKLFLGITLRFGRLNIVGLGFKLERKKYMSCIQNPKAPTVECLRNGNYHVYRKLFQAKQHFLKLQEPRNLQKNVKLCTLETNNFILG